MDQSIKAVQEVFNSNPFGTIYPGPKDGEMNPDFINKCKELEIKIGEVSGAPIIGKIISGEKLVANADDLSRVFSLIKSYQNFLKSSAK